MKQQIQELEKLVIESDRMGARNLVERMLAEGVSRQAVMTDVLNPALAHIGGLWEKKNASLSQIFVVAKIAEDILVRCSPSTQVSDGSRGVAVLGNIEDDYHSLGRRIVASFLSTAGWEVHDLGNDVTAETFIETALETGACVIGASAMMQTTALHIRRVREQLDARGLSGKIKLAVGGGRL